MNYLLQQSLNLFLRICYVLGIKIVRWRNSYFSYIPDRYSLNFKKYKSNKGFLDYKDLTAWNSGNYFNNIGDASRFFFLNLCIDTLREEKITGNVAEIGVYKGNSASLLARYARTVGSKCFLFDTFSGFDESDKVGHDAGFEATYAETSLERVKHLVGEENTIFIQGHVPSSLSLVDPAETFCLVHIDCDLGQPIMSALEYFYPRVVKGGFLIVHDHSSLFWPGCTESVNHFFHDKLEFVIPIPDKSGTCVIRKINHTT